MLSSTLKFQSQYWIKSNRIFGGSKEAKLNYTKGTGTETNRGIITEQTEIQKRTRNFSLQTLALWLLKFLKEVMLR